MGLGKKIEEENVVYRFWKGLNGLPRKPYDQIERCCKQKFLGGLLLERTSYRILKS